jgi:hypothetical protein
MGEVDTAGDKRPRFWGIATHLDLAGAQNQAFIITGLTRSSKGSETYEAGNFGALCKHHCLSLFVFRLVLHVPGDSLWPPDALL